MNIYTIETNYKNAIEDIYKQSSKLLNLNELNNQVKYLNEQYHLKLKDFYRDVNSFSEKFDLNKITHIQTLKNKLMKYNLNKEFETFSDGNIRHNIDEIENYLKDSKYVDEIEIIISINIYSTFNSIRNKSKKAYPLLNEIIDRKKYALQLKTNCPFCNQDIVVDVYKRTQNIHDYELKEITKCSCDIPELLDRPFRLRNFDYKESLEKINKLTNSHLELIEPKITKSFLKSIHDFVEDKYQNYYHFKLDYQLVYNDEIPFDRSISIDKQIWSKIKKHDFSLFNDFKPNNYEYDKLQKIENALVSGLKILSLEKLIDSLSISLLSISGNTTYQINIYDIEPIKQIYKINSTLIDFIKNYKKKEKEPNEVAQNEALALGYYCKSQNISMEDICEYTSMIDFCKQHHIEFDEIKGYIIQKLLD